MWEQQLCRHQGQWRRAMRCFRCQSWDSPEAPDEDMMRQVVTLQPMEVHGWAAPGGPHTASGVCLKNAVILWEAHDGGACSWQTAPCERDPCYSSSQRTAELQPGGMDSQWRTSQRTICCGRNPMVEQGQERGHSSPSEGGSSRDCNPLSPSPCTSGGEEGENPGTKVNLGKREMWWEGNVKTWFYFSLSCSDLIGNKLNSFLAQAESVLPMTDEWALPVIFLAHKTFCYILFPMRSCGGIGQLWWAPDHEPESSHQREWLCFVYSFNSRIKKEKMV